MRDEQDESAREDGDETPQGTGTMHIHEASVPGPDPLSRAPTGSGGPGNPPHVQYRAVVVLGEQEAVVLEVKPWDLHGVGYVDVTVVFPDRAVENARLGAESIPENLEPGERVMVSRAVNMIVSIRRV